jgi:hypothetical protein
MSDDNDSPFMGYDNVTARQRSSPVRLRDARRLLRLRDALWLLKLSRFGDEATFPTLGEVRAALHAAEELSDD